MTATTARVRLRYRPSADVLTGELHLPHSADAPVVTEQPDGDATMHWSVDVDGRHFLSSFHLVHASARANAGALLLPIPLESRVLLLMNTARSALDDVGDATARLRAKAEADFTVAVESVERSLVPSRVVRSPLGRPPEAATVSDELWRVATTVGIRAVGDNHPEAAHTQHFSRLLKELSSTIDAGCGRTAPGTSSAARAAMRDGVRMTVDERDRLERALTALDDSSSWEWSWLTLHDLADSMERPRP